MEARMMLVLYIYGWIFFNGVLVKSVKFVMISVSFGLASVCFSLQLLLNCSRCVIYPLSI